MESVFVKCEEPVDGVSMAAMHKKGVPGFEKLDIACGDGKTQAVRLIEYNGGTSFLNDATYTGRYQHEDRELDRGDPTKYLKIEVLQSDLGAAKRLAEQVAQKLRAQFGKVEVMGV